MLLIDILRLMQQLLRLLAWPISSGHACQPDGAERGKTGRASSFMFLPCFRHQMGGARTRNLRPTVDVTVKTVLTLGAAICKPGPSALYGEGVGTLLEAIFVLLLDRPDAEFASRPKNKLQASTDLLPVYDFLHDALAAHQTSSCCRSRTENRQCAPPAPHECDRQRPARSRA